LANNEIFNILKSFISGSVFNSIFKQGQAFVSCSLDTNTFIVLGVYQVILSI